MDPTLDHVGIVVPDLDEAARFVEALGFTLTRRAEHLAAGGTPGSAQVSIMLERGYIEIQSLADLHGAHPVAPAARRYFGLHILAFAVSDAAGAHEQIERQGLPVGPILRWSRAIAEPDLGGDARFDFFVGDYGPDDETFLCWTQHLTPELLRSPRLTTHANGARRLDGVLVATAEDPAILAQRYVRCGGVLETGSNGGAVVRFGPARIEIASRSKLPPAIADSHWPASSWAAAPLLGVRDNAGLTARAEALGCPTFAADGRTFIDVRSRLACWLAATAVNA